MYLISDKDTEKLWRGSHVRRAYFCEDDWKVEKSDKGYVISTDKGPGYVGSLCDSVYDYDLYVEGIGEINVKASTFHSFEEEAIKDVLRRFLVRYSTIPGNLVLVAYDFVYARGVWGYVLSEGTYVASETAMDEMCHRYGDLFDRWSRVRERIQLEEAFDLLVENRFCPRDPVNSTFFITLVGDTYKVSKRGNVESIITAYVEGVGKVTVEVGGWKQEEDRDMMDAMALFMRKYARNNKVWIFYYGMFSTGRMVWDNVEKKLICGGELSEDYKGAWMCWVEYMRLAKFYEAEQCLRGAGFFGVVKNS